MLKKDKEEVMFPKLHDLLGCVCKGDLFIYVWPGMKWEAMKSNCNLHWTARRTTRQTPNYSAKPQLPGSRHDCHGRCSEAPPAWPPRPLPPQHHRRDHQQTNAARHGRKLEPESKLDDHHISDGGGDRGNYQMEVSNNTTQAESCTIVKQTYDIVNHRCTSSNIKSNHERANVNHQVTRCTIIKTHVKS